MGAADDVRASTDEAWRAFRDALTRVDLEAVTSSGWTVKEMVAHVAFWLETVPPFVTGAFRGDSSAFAVTFPSGYAAAEDWPSTDEHNAREAAWARDQSAEVVLARADRAFAEARSFLDTVTDDEVAAHTTYFTGDLAGHLETHRVSELEPLAG